MVAILVVCCKGKIEKVKGDFSSLPLQRIDSLFAVQTKNGKVVMRIEAKVMERYDNDSSTFESFPEGLSVYGYNEEGLLESILVSDDARHITWKSKDKGEVWQAFGNVFIHNVLKNETMETDTLYWNQSKHEIHTDCYVKLYSPDGFMQGYGMTSDDHARNAILHKPFNSFGVTQQDTTKVQIDSANFIGPLLNN